MELFLSSYIPSFVITMVLFTRKPKGGDGEEQNPKPAYIGTKLMPFTAIKTASVSAFTKDLSVVPGWDESVHSVGEGHE